MKFKIPHIALLLLIVTTVGVSAQDIQFSQFYAAPLRLNPALLGIERSVTFGANVRRQETNLDDPADIIHAFAMVPFFKGGPGQNQLGGVGISFLSSSSPVSVSSSLIPTNAAQGITENQSSIFLSGAFNMPLKFDGSEVITFGAQVGFSQIRYEEGDISSGIQNCSFCPDGRDESIDPTIPNFAGENVSYPTINVGVMYYFNPKKSYILLSGSAFSGITVSNINRPDETPFDDGEDRIPINYQYQGGIEFFLLPKLKWTPTTIINYQNQDFQFNAGNYFSYNIGRNRGISTQVSEIILGAWYRYRDAAIISAGYNRASWGVGFSYDFNASFLGSEKSALGPALELSLSYRIIKDKALRTFSTPLL
ncbi:MAG: PorP/SprF family type IX secretion system membrane protein [Bacteroidota bacterium]